MPDIKEKLVEIMRKKPFELTEGSARYVADHLLAHGVTIQKWISVEERLPELEEEVLVCDIDNDRNYKDVWSLEDDEDGGVVWAGKNGEWYSLDEVTHWMPLPEPPKGE